MQNVFRNECSNTIICETNEVEFDVNVFYLSFIIIVWLEIK